MLITNGNQSFFHKSPLSDKFIKYCSSFNSNLAGNNKYCKVEKKSLFRTPDLFLRRSSLSMIFQVFFVYEVFYCPKRFFLKQINKLASFCTHLLF